MIDRTQIRAERLAFFKGLGYIATGISLITLSLVFSGLAFNYLGEFPTVNPVAPSVIFWITLLTGTVWGSILVWKGWGILVPKGTATAPQQRDSTKQ